MSGASRVAESLIVDGRRLCGGRQASRSPEQWLRAYGEVNPDELVEAQLRVLNELAVRIRQMREEQQGSAQV